MMFLLVRLGLMWMLLVLLGRWNEKFDVIEMIVLSLDVMSFVVCLVSGWKWYMNVFINVMFVFL